MKNEMNIFHELPRAADSLSSKRSAHNRTYRLFRLVVAVAIAGSAFAQVATRLDEASPLRQKTRSSSLPGEQMTAAQKAALAALGPDVRVAFDDQEVPSSIAGQLAYRTHLADPVAEAQAALDRYGPAFRRGASDGFRFASSETDKAAVLSVHMNQTYKGIPVLGGELTVRLTPDQVTAISGRFVSGLDLPVDSPGGAGLAVKGTRVNAKRESVIFVDGDNAGHLAYTADVTSGDADQNMQETVVVEANTGNVLGRSAAAPNLQTIGNALRNPGFELGSNGDWSEVHAQCGTPGKNWLDCVITLPPDIIVTGHAAFGQYSAWLDGYGEKTNDVLSQSVTVPSLAGSGGLNFLLRIATSEITTSNAYDNLIVGIYSPNGVAILPEMHFSNLDATTYANYKSVSIPPFDLRKYAGQKITVSFAGHEDLSNQTSFFIDNVLLSFTTLP